MSYSGYRSAQKKNTYLFCPVCRSDLLFHESLSNEIWLDLGTTIDLQKMNLLKSTDVA